MLEVILFVQYTTLRDGLWVPSEVIHVWTCTPRFILLGCIFVICEMTLLGQYISLRDDLLIHPEVILFIQYTSLHRLGML